MVLETPEERVALLKAGIPGKAIEMLYIKGNGFGMRGEPGNFHQMPKKFRKV